MSAVQAFENTLEKGEIAHDEQFLLFPQCFLPFLENVLQFSSNLKLSSTNSFSVEKSKMCCLGKSQWFDISLLYGFQAGELVYNHDLSKEFKAFFDGAFTLKKMKEHAARCICGFLNSDKKGMLLFGIHNDGEAFILCQATKF